MTGAPHNGNEWKKYRVVPRARPSCTLRYAYFTTRSGSKGASGFPGATWDHFRCTVQPRCPEVAAATKSCGLRQWSLRGFCDFEANPKKLAASDCLAVGKAKNPAISAAEWLQTCLRAPWSLRFCDAIFVLLHGGTLVSRSYLVFQLSVRLRLHQSLKLTWRTSALPKKRQIWTSRRMLSG